MNHKSVPFVFVLLFSCIVAERRFTCNKALVSKTITYGSLEDDAVNTISVREDGTPIVGGLLNNVGFYATDDIPVNIIDSASGSPCLNVKDVVSGSTKDYFLCESLDTVSTETLATIYTLENGTTKLYSSTLGATSAYGTSIVLPKENNPIIGGGTDSPFAFGVTVGNSNDAFYASYLDGELSDVYFLGGGFNDAATDMDFSGNTFYVVGNTNSWNFPELGGGDGCYSDATQAFVASAAFFDNPDRGYVFNNPLTTYCLGDRSSNDYATAVKVDGALVYVVGYTQSPTFCGQTNPGLSGYLRILNFDGTERDCTLIGPGNGDHVNKILLVGDTIVLAGTTKSGANFPIVGSSLACSESYNDAFVMVLHKTNFEILYSACFAGDGEAIANDIAVGPDGRLYVVGSASSAKLGQLPPRNDSDGFLINLSCRYYGTLAGDCPVTCYGLCLDDVSYCFKECPIVCPDGQCAQNATQCDSGCPANAPYRCSTGYCAADATSCFCRPGVTYCIDGTCNDNCTFAPVSLVPLEIDLYFDSRQNFTTSIYSPRGDIGTVTLPSGLFNSTDQILKIKGVPLTYLRTLKYLTEEGLGGVLSSVVDLKLASNVSMFDIPVTISLNVTIPLRYQGLYTFCLAYINANDTWECVDNNIVQSGPGQFTGVTTHFSSFAVLISGKNDDSTTTDGSSSSSSNIDSGVGVKVIVPIVVVAVVAIIAGLVAAIIISKKKKAREDEALNSVEMRVRDSRA